METQEKKVQGSKATQPKKAGHAYSVKRFSEAVTAINSTGLVDEKDMEQLNSLKQKIAMKYLGI